MTAAGPGESLLLALDVVPILESAGVSYAVIGAMAAAVHGVVRASVDADLLISIAVPGMTDLARRLTESGFDVELRRGDPDDPIAGMLVVRDSHGNQVDMLVGLRGAEPALFGRAIEVPLAGAQLRIVGREDFIAMKAYAGGPKDLMDAQRAIAAADDSLDRALLERITERFGAAAVATLRQLLAKKP
jgi:predicted nucleotidyltransferase